jgi:hypothetical protein
MKKGLAIIILSTSGFGFSQYEISEKGKGVGMINNITTEDIYVPKGYSKIGVSMSGPNGRSRRCSTDSVGNLTTYDEQMISNDTIYINRGGLITISSVIRNNLISTFNHITPFFFEEGTGVFLEESQVVYNNGQGNAGEYNAKIKFEKEAVLTFYDITFTGYLVDKKPFKVTVMPTDDIVEAASIAHIQEEVVVAVFKFNSNGIAIIAESEKDSRMSVYSLQGELVTNRVFRGESNLLHSELESGVYLIHISNEFGVISKRVFVGR